jgi:ABC-type Fe3+-citrate transport system substrate-binding protein
MLTEFLKETKGMEVGFIGSLLLSKLEANYQFQIKAKALYAIEYLIKKNKEYEAYFKKHNEKIREFP